MLSRPLPFLSLYTALPLALPVAVVVRARTRAHLVFILSRHPSYSFIHLLHPPCPPSSPPISPKHSPAPTRLRSTLRRRLSHTLAAQFIFPTHPKHSSHEPSTQAIHVRAQASTAYRTQCSSQRRPSSSADTSQ